MPSHEQHSGSTIGHLAASGQAAEHIVESGESGKTKHAERRPRWSALVATAMPLDTLSSFVFFQEKQHLQYLPPGVRTWSTAAQTIKPEHQQ
jgi:hypothetical protein